MSSRTAWPPSILLSPGILLGVKMLIQLLGKVGQLRAGFPTWIWNHLKHPIGKALRIACPVVADITIKKTPGKSCCYPVFLSWFLLDPEQLRQRCWGKSYVPCSAYATATLTQHFKCLYFGSRRLELQAGETMQILMKIYLKPGLSSKHWWAKGFYLRHFFPCEEP